MRLPVLVRELFVGFSLLLEDVWCVFSYRLSVFLDRKAWRLRSGRYLPQPSNSPAGIAHAAQPTRVVVRSEPAWRSRADGTGGVRSCIPTLARPNECQPVRPMISSAHLTKAPLRRVFSFKGRTERRVRASAWLQNGCAQRACYLGAAHQPQQGELWRLYVSLLWKGSRTGSCTRPRRGGRVDARPRGALATAARSARYAPRPRCLRSGWSSTPL